MSCVARPPLKGSVGIKVFELFYSVTFAGNKIIQDQESKQLNILIAADVTYLSESPWLLRSIP